MMLSLYRGATVLAAPFIQYYLNKRKAEGKEDAARFSERLGQSSRPRPNGTLIWMHAASVGESLSLLPLIDKLLADLANMQILVTTGTTTSAKLMEDRLPARAFHQYIPVDRLSYVRRFLDHWRPDLTLWAESEFWPNLITETHDRQIPMILINGRISPKAFSGWQKAQRLIARLLRCFDLCLGQSDEDVERLLRLGAKSSKCVGNLKFAVPALPVVEADLAELQSKLSDRPRWLTASTHPGEESIVAQVHRDLRSTHAGLLTIIVPRHPARGSEIAQALRDQGLTVAIRSRNESLAAGTDIYIADTMGEMGLFFRLADIVFMGKSLVPLGGQNPLEAFRLNCAVIHGPHMMNFQWMSEEMARMDCAVTVQDQASLAAAANELLIDPGRCRAMADNGTAFVESQAQVVDLIADEVKAVLAKHKTKALSDAAA